VKSNLYYLIILFAYVLTAVSCGSSGKNHPSDTVGDTLTMRYARQITLVRHNDYTEAVIHNPWQAAGSVLSRYEIRKPLTHSAIFIASIAALVNELGCIDAISGVCEPEYIANRQIHAAIDEGRIMDIGSAMTPSRERLIDLSPDAILLSPFQNVGSYGNIEQLGIPIIPCADYMEESALARAEWMRFYGRLFGVGERADSLFATVEEEYKKMKSTESGEDKSVFFDGRSGSAWYMPGGHSTLGQMVADAGGHYVFADNEQSGSVPFSFEQVYNRCRDADFWLFRYNARERMTLSMLRSKYEPYSRFRAFQQGKVYGCNNAELIFFEEYPYHPERLLRDFIRIFSGQTDSLRYFHQMQ
jgi:iron complex transport system substrate-binding protein